MSHHLDAPSAHQQIADRLRAADQRRLARQARHTETLDYEPAEPAVVRRPRRLFRAVAA